jgi:hydroxymethylpyrimidine kinase/phosphomethylpyrimidine kinase
MAQEIPVALTIAGSDSGGGAGIQADLKTFHALGCFGTSAVTAITCQNTTGVSAVQGVDPQIVTGQIRDVLADFPVRAAKTGMLFSREIIVAVRDEWRRSGAGIPLVIDPVMVAASGQRLLHESADLALIDFLSEAFLITPNLPEAEVILRRTTPSRKTLSSLGDMEAAVIRLYEKCGTAVLLKGGHRVPDDERAGEAVDLYYDGTNQKQFARPVLPGRNTHGTGCTLSAAIAAGLARGHPILDAITEARDYLHGAIEHAPDLGAGSGPLNHMWRQPG